MTGGWQPRASRPKHAVRWAIRPRAVLWDRNCRTRVGPAQRANNRRLAADYPVISRRSPGSRPARHQAHRRPTARDPAASVGIRSMRREIHWLAAVAAFLALVGHRSHAFAPHGGDLRRPACVGVSQFRFLAGVRRRTRAACAFTTLLR